MILATEFFKDFFEKVNPNKVKFKFNVNNGGSIPALEYLLNNEEEWDIMNSWREEGSANNNLDAYDYVFTFAQYYHYGVTYYLFGGIYKVVDSDCSVEKGKGYNLELQEDYKEYKGRLIVKTQQNVGLSYARKFDNFSNNLNPEIYALLPVANFGEFTGYQNVRLSFKELHHIIKKNDPQWNNALKNVKGIYVITDTNTGKLYIGSAYGKDGGIWGRWSNYIDNYTGENNGIEKILEEKGEEYIKNNFQYSIIEIFDTKTKDDYILDREKYWKKVFYSKEHGMNEN